MSINKTIDYFTVFIRQLSEFFLKFRHLTPYL